MFSKYPAPSVSAEELNRARQAVIAQQQLVERQMKDSSISQKGMHEEMQHLSSLANAYNNNLMMLDEQQSRTSLSP
jgi:hypothetical protein